MSGRLIALYLFVVLTASSPVAVSAQDNEQTQIRQLVQQFFSAYTNEDIEGLMSLWSEQSDREASRQRFLKTFQDHQNIEIKSLEMGKITIEADQAKVLLQIDVSAVDAKSGKPAAGFGKMNRTFHLAKQGGIWKVRQYIATEEELAVALVALKTETERRALFDANKDLHTRPLMSSLIAKEQFSREGNLAQALHVYRLAYEIAKNIGDNESVAVLSNIIAVIQYGLGDLAGALASYEEALTIYEKLGLKPRIPDVLNEIGQIYSSRADYSQALEYFKRSLTLAEELGDKKTIAYALNSIGTVYSFYGDYLPALEYYRRSLALCEEIKDSRLIASPLMNIGSTYRILGNNALALEYYQRSLQFSEALNDKRRTAIILSNISQIYYSQGNYPQALEYVNKALALAQEAGHKADVVKYEHLIGNIHEARRDYAQALAHYEKSLSLNEPLGQKSVTAFTLQSIGNVHHAEGRNDRALEYFKQSLALAEEVGETSAISSAQIGLGAIYLSQGNNEGALAAAERALALASQMQKPDVLWMSHNLMGRAQRALNHLDAARRSLDNAIEVIEKMRAGLAGGEQEAHRFLEDKLAPYHSMIELLIASKNFPAALVYAERAKARTLLDVLSSGRANVTKAMTKEEEERERALNNQIVMLNSQLLQANQQREQARSTELKARLEKARLEYEAFQASLYAAHPELKVQRGQPPVFTVAEADKLLLGGQTAILEYVVGEKNSYLFVLTRVAGVPVMTVHTLGLSRNELETSTESFRQQVATRDLTFKSQARRLYDQLIKPAEKQLRGAGANKLILVPDGPLWELPFQALYRDERYLLDDFAISYAPSLSVLREMKRNDRQIWARPPFVRHPIAADSLTKKYVSDLLALGNPVLNTREVAKRSLLREDELGPLPSAETEVNMLGQLYGRNRSKILVGEKATEEEVKAEAEKYRLLHFAAHAVLDDRNPMYSRIMLSRQEDGEDGMLEAWELMKLDLSAEMVVLSACQTARGRVGAGEGMIGMSWALFVAGSPAVVVSQWKVDSERTSELMIAFHRNLLRRESSNRTRAAMTKAEALRLAALKLRHGRYNHPAYWAGFVLIGNER